MADFVAVIRRAVDGLANNTPEMRAKVYDKARGAVQRQLENMKPRPPEDMLLRQMEKLEAAITEVESEHTEALEPVDDAAAAPPVTEEAPVEQYGEEPGTERAAGEPAEELEEQASQPVAEHYEEEQPAEASEQAPEAYQAQPEPVEVEPAPVQQDESLEEPSPAGIQAERATEDAPVGEPPAFGEEEAVASASAEEEPAVPKYGDWRDDIPPEEPVSAPPAYDHSEPEQPEPVQASGTETPGSVVGQPEPVEDWGWQETSAPAPSHGAHVAAVWNDVPELVPTGPVEPIDRGVTAEAVDAHFHPQTHAAADTVRMPSVSDLPDIPPPRSETGSTASADPFADYLDQKPKADVKSAESDPWGDLEELIGYNKDASSSAASPQSALHTEADADDLMPAPARPYRVTPVRKRNYAGIILAIIGLALVGAGGYAIWLNRDSLNDMVDGLIQSSLPGSQTAEQTPTPAPVDSTPSETPATPAPAPQNNAENPPAPTTPAPADGSSAGTKFTQRLMPDGSEVDDGPGDVGSLAQNAEGQSVAQLNSPPATPEPAATPPAPNAPAPAGSPPAESAPNAAAPSANAPSANPADVPALSGEKIFLYEERIGQTAPTAIDGAVSWSLQREAGANGQQEPVIQGRVTVPGRGLSALVTLKRNTDSSLPASHLIEIVFAVPPDFEGGAIDSVQRIAMKQTEQDRGNALIAVPAKITDDFHMIALNDFPDARATNLELLRSRNWMDIPVAYRNGRRALFTLQKGQEGERVFNEAINEWNALGTATSGQ